VGGDEDAPGIVDECLDLVTACPVFHNFTRLEVLIGQYIVGTAFPKVALRIYMDATIVMILRPTGVGMYRNQFLIGLVYLEQPKAGRAYQQLAIGQLGHAADTGIMGFGIDIEIVRVSIIFHQAPTRAYPQVAIAVGKEA